MKQVKINFFIKNKHVKHNVRSNLDHQKHDEIMNLFYEFKQKVEVIANES